MAVMQSLSNRCSAAKLPAHCSVSRLALLVGEGPPTRAHMHPHTHRRLDAPWGAAFPAPLALRWSLARATLAPLVPRPRPPPTPMHSWCHAAAALVSLVVLTYFTFDAAKVEGMLVWVQENKQEGSVLFLVRRGEGMCRRRSARRPRPRPPACPPCLPPSCSLPPPHTPASPPSRSLPPPHTPAVHPRYTCAAGVHRGRRAHVPRHGHGNGGGRGVWPALRHAARLAGQLRGPDAGVCDGQVRHTLQACRGVVWVEGQGVSVSVCVCSCACMAGARCALCAPSRVAARPRPASPASSACWLGRGAPGG